MFCKRHVSKTDLETKMCSVKKLWPVSTEFSPLDCCSIVLPGSYQGLYVYILYIYRLGRLTPFRGIVPQKIFSLGSQIPNGTLGKEHFLCSCHIPLKLNEMIVLYIHGVHTIHIQTYYNSSLCIRHLYVYKNILTMIYMIKYLCRQIRFQSQNADLKKSPWKRKNIQFHVGLPSCIKMHTRNMN